MSNRHHWFRSTGPVRNTLSRVLQSATVIPSNLNSLVCPAAKFTGSLLLSSDNLTLNAAHSNLVTRTLESPSPTRRTNPRVSSVPSVPSSHPSPTTLTRLSRS